MTPNSMSPLSLDALLGDWATQQRLSPREAATIGDRIVATESAALEQERLWQLLRPVTALLQGPHALHAQLSRPYLRLA